MGLSPRRGASRIRNVPILSRLTNPPREAALHRARHSRRPRSRGAAISHRNCRRQRSLFAQHPTTGGRGKPARAVPRRDRRAPRRASEPNETADFGPDKSPICCLVAVRKAARRLNATVPSQFSALTSRRLPRQVSLRPSRLAARRRPSWLRSLSSPPCGHVGLPCGPAWPRRCSRCGLHRC
jgi:hypothetical protein